MKKIFFILFSGIIIASCGNTDKTKTPVTGAADIGQTSAAAADTANYTTIEWLDATSKDLGTVKEDGDLDIAFRFKNTGDKPLQIISASASCGCTVPEPPKEPIAPGGEGVIKAKFNTVGRTGPNNKQITVTANTTPQQHMLSFTVVVEKK